MKRKMVSLDKKMVSDFDIAPPPHPHLMQTHLWWICGVAICKIISMFLKDFELGNLFAPCGTIVL